MSNTKKETKNEQREWQIEHQSTIPIIDFNQLVFFSALLLAEKLWKQFVRIMFLMQVYWTNFYSRNSAITKLTSFSINYQNR